MLTSENQGVSLGKKNLKRPNRDNLSSGGFFWFGVWLLESPDTPVCIQLGPARGRGLSGLGMVCWGMETPHLFLWLLRLDSAALS